MRYAPLLACCVVVVCPALAFADPMPVLPDLPPLPTNYQSQGTSGLYAGILTGFARGPQAGLGLALVVGNTFEAADLLLGVEAIGYAATHGEVTVEGSLRAGIPLTDVVTVFGATGLGYSFDTAAFVSVGASLEADLGGDWLVRADYRYNHDLSGDAGTHKVLMGLMHGF
ncbi:MAG: hypothetical protein ACOH2R_28530 [Pseudomonas sp.]